VFNQGNLDQVRVSRVCYRGTEWVTLRHWALDPGHGWNLTNTVSLRSDEVAVAVTALAPQRTPKKHTQ
jgi:hypothetical protein